MPSLSGTPMTPRKSIMDVAAQIADDADFTQNVRTLFNNDRANDLGLGVGANREGSETNEGRLIEAKGAKARYVRLIQRQHGKPAQ